MRATNAIPPNAKGIVKKKSSEQQTASGSTVRKTSDVVLSLIMSQLLVCAACMGTLERIDAHMQLCAEVSSSASLKTRVSVASPIFWRGPTAAGCEAWGEA